jgi:hypothetical protein
MQRALTPLESRVSSREDSGRMKSTTLTALKEFPRHLEAYFAAIPAGFENWRPDSWMGIPSEPFTAIEQICHVRDVEIEGYHVRFLRTLQEANPSLPDLAGEALARERAYATADAGQVLASFREARARSVALIAGLTDQELARVAEFDGVPTTLRALVHYLCSHDQQHLAGLQWLLARIESRRARR